MIFQWDKDRYGALVLSASCPGCNSLNDITRAGRPGAELALPANLIAKKVQLEERWNKFKLELGRLPDGIELVAPTIEFETGNDPECRTWVYALECHHCRGPFWVVATPGLRDAWGGPGKIDTKAALGKILIELQRKNGRRRRGRRTEPRR